MNIIINGADGCMGKILKSRIETCENLNISFLSGIKDGYVSLSNCRQTADVVIDFSDHKAARELIDYCLLHKTPAVIATTGHTKEEKLIIQDAAETIPVFYSANMSVGIALLLKLAKEAVKMLPNADIEIVEVHHNRKKDVPSGTALMLADGIKQIRDEGYFVIGRTGFGSRKKEEIGIHSVRLGCEAGTHEIILSTGSQNIFLKHEAKDRSLFADGAIEAAKFIVNKPAGLYSMEDLIKQNT